MIPNIRAVIDGVIHVTVDDINTADDTYSYCIVYQDTSTTGSFATTTSYVALAADTTGYTVYDADATSTLYYKALLSLASDSTATATALGDARGYGTQAAYCTALDVRGELGMGARTNVDAKSDHWLWERAVQVSRLIDEYCGCPETSDLAYLASTSAIRYFTADGSDELWLDTPATSISTVEVEETDGTWTEYESDDDYWPWPWNDTPYRKLVIQDRTTSEETNWDDGHRRVRVTGVWGLATSVPDLIKGACVAQVAIWYKRAMTGWRTREGNTQFGFVEYPSALDDDVKRMLDGVHQRVKRLVF